MANVCTRSYIHWERDRERDTSGDVLVLTSPQKTFVDVRMTPDAKGISGVYPHAALSWAFSGVSKSRVDDPSKQTTYSRWYHTVDSRHVEASKVLDEGHMTTQADGSTLETGEMAYPATGEVRKYEEVWVDLPFVDAAEHAEGTFKVVVLVFGCGARRPTASSAPNFDERAGGVVVRLGDWCQGILRVGDSFTVERWKFIRDTTTSIAGNWKRLIRVGDGFVPCGVAMDEKTSTRIQVGSQVTFEGMVWNVSEVDEVHS